VSQSNRITLASGQITPGAAIIVELVRASETPEAILVHWPSAPSVVTPARLTVTINAVIRILAQVRTRLAQIRAAELP
jgi:hypothetical protein